MHYNGTPDEVPRSGHTIVRKTDSQEEDEGLHWDPGDYSDEEVSMVDVARLLPDDVQRHAAGR